MTRLLITRPERQAGELARALADAGIESVAVPTISIRPAGPALDAALRGLDGAAWLVITSANGADAVVERLRALHTELPDGTRLAAVGPATSAALRDGGLTVHHVPDAYRTVAIAEGLGPVAGARIVLARADAATPDLPRALRARGAIVEEVVAYRTLEGPASSRTLLAAALEGGIDGVTFTSGSTVRGLVRLARADQLVAVRRQPTYCIGPVTAEVATTAGFTVRVTATEHTATGLAEAIAGHLAQVAKKIA